MQSEMSQGNKALICAVESRLQLEVLDAAEILQNYCGYFRSDVTIDICFAGN